MTTINKALVELADRVVAAREYMEECEDINAVALKKYEEAEARYLDGAENFEEYQTTGEDYDAAYTALVNARIVYNNLHDAMTQLRTIVDRINPYWQD